MPPPNRPFPDIITSVPPGLHDIMASIFEISSAADTTNVLSQIPSIETSVSSDLSQATSDSSSTARLVSISVSTSVPTTMISATTLSESFVHQNSLSLGIQTVGSVSLASTEAGKGTPTPEISPVGPKPCKSLLCHQSLYAAAIVPLVLAGLAAVIIGISLRCRMQRQNKHGQQEIARKQRESCIEFLNTLWSDVRSLWRQCSHETNASERGEQVQRLTDLRYPGIRHDAILPRPDSATDNDLHMIQTNTLPASFVNCTQPETAAGEHPFFPALSSYDADFVDDTNSSASSRVNPFSDLFSLDRLDDDSYVCSLFDDTVENTSVDTSFGQAFSIRSSAPSRVTSDNASTQADTILSEEKS